MPWSISCKVRWVNLAATDTLVSLINTSIGIPIIKIRQSPDCLIFIMRIPLLVRQPFFLSIQPSGVNDTRIFVDTQWHQSCCCSMTLEHLWCCSMTPEHLGCYKADACDSLRIIKIKATDCSTIIHHNIYLYKPRHFLGKTLEPTSNHTMI